MIGLIAATNAGREAAQRLADAWPERIRVYDGPAGEAIRTAWSECEGLVCFLAVGAVVRVIAPLLTDKAADPAVVCVDEATRFAVAVLGGHAAGANHLADEVAAVLAALPVVTTATDATGIPGLDSLGWPIEGAVAAVSRAILDGTAVRFEADADWPLPALPGNLGATGQFTLLVTDRSVPVTPSTVVLRPPSLVIGVGASRGVSADEVLALVDATLTGAGLSAQSVCGLATVEAKAHEVGLLQAAALRGWTLATFPATELAAIEVPNPSAAPLSAVGTASVAEAAALAAGRPGAQLIVTKQKSAMATVAVARRTPRGRLLTVGIGPGARDLLAPRAVAALRSASVVVGLDQYVDQIRDLLRPGTRLLTSGLGDEQARADTAVAEARLGHAVALVCSGDAGVYAMASPALESAGTDIDVEGVPGITASLAAAALLGAPLGHDHATISLSDLHTPWEAIENRITAAAVGDFVVSFYNPRSRSRDWQLAKALEILAGRRPPDTPVGIVRQGGRPEQSVRIVSLSDVDVDTVDMFSVVIVGSSNTRLIADRMVTPRGYRWRT